MRVLFVDDEEKFLTPLIKRITKRGMIATGVTSGKKALMLLENETFDVVVLDLKMPGMCGHTTLKNIQAQHPRLPIIMLTGHADLDDTVRGLELGALDHLMKPIIIDELIYRIEDAYKTSTLNVQPQKEPQVIDGGEITGR